MQDKQNQQRSTKTTLIRILRMLQWTKLKYKFKVLQNTLLLLSKHRQWPNSQNTSVECKRSEFCRLLSLFTDLQIQNQAFTVTS